MPHNILMSKIRCNSPNQKSTPTKNKNHLLYIATREGVDLTPSQHDFFNKNFISHGLFGNLNQEKIADIDDLGKDIYELSKNKSVMRGIVSLSEEDALELGFDQKNSWEAYMHSVMPAIGKEFNIPVDRLSWVAAVHMEKGHPHAHYMFWRNDDRILNSFIHPVKQQRCREVLSAKMFESERQQEIINKTMFRDLIIEIGKDLFSEKKEEILSMIVPGMHMRCIPGKISEKSLDKMSEYLLDIVQTLPKTGRISYKLLPPATKEKLDKIVGVLVKSPELCSAYESYINSIKNISKTYSVTGDKSERNIEKARKDIYTRLANIILKNAAQIRNLRQENFSQKEKDVISFSYTTIRACLTSLNTMNHRFKQSYSNEFISDSKAARKELSKKLNNGKLPER